MNVLLAAALAAVAGTLFAYGGRTLMDDRVNASDGVVLYVRGGTAAGCWAVTVSTGGRAGMVVSQSVVTS